MDELMTIPRDLVGAMMKRTQHLEEGIGRIYLTHKKTGCKGCDVCMDLQQVLTGGFPESWAASGAGGGPPAWVLPLMEHEKACGYPDTDRTCPLGPKPEVLCKCGHPRRFHTERGDGTPPHGPCYLRRTEVKTCPCDHFEAPEVTSQASLE
jgi:hypothetical protein